MVRIYRFSLDLNVRGLYYGEGWPYLYARWYDVHRNRNRNSSWLKMGVPNGIHLFVHTSEED